MTDNVPYIAVFATYRDAELGVKDFMKTHYTIVKVDKRGYRFTVTMRDGTEYIFMPFEIYKKWHIGQTYKHIGEEELWHSGYKLEGDKQ